MSFYTDSTSVRVDLLVEGDKDVDYLYVDGPQVLFSSQLHMRNLKFAKENSILIRKIGFHFQ